MKTDLTEEQGQKLCEANGYILYRQYPSGRDACICRIGGNHAILADLNNAGYSERWCYHSLVEAILALDAWDGGDDTEPQGGWHRHIPSGRRRPDGDASKEYINW